MQENNYKICVLGDKNVGKSSIIMQFTHEKFKCPLEYDAQIFTLGCRIHEKLVQLGRKRVVFKIHDPYDIQKAIDKGFFKDIKGAILVFDLTNRETFRNTDYWLKIFKNQVITMKNYPPLILIGNKSDFEHNIQISNEEISSLIENELIIKFFKCSAKDFYNINEIFYFFINREESLI